MKKPKSKVAAFLAEKSVKKKRCMVCDNKPASAALDEIIAARRSGESRVSVGDVRAFLRSEFKFDASTSLLLYCAEEHRGGLWSSHVESK